MADGGLVLNSYAQTLKTFNDLVTQVNTFLYRTRLQQKKTGCAGNS